MYNCSPDYELLYQDAKKENEKLIQALKSIYIRAVEVASKAEDVSGYNYIISVVQDALEDKK
jgi:hypothetical protein